MHPVTFDPKISSLRTRKLEIFEKMKSLHMIRSVRAKQFSSRSLHNQNGLNSKRLGHLPSGLLCVLYFLLKMCRRFLFGCNFLFHIISSFPPHNVLFLFSPHHFPPAHPSPASLHRPSACWDSPRRPSPASVLPRPFVRRDFLTYFLRQSLPFLCLAGCCFSYLSVQPSLFTAVAVFVFLPLFSHLFFALSASPLVSSSPVEPSIIDLSFFSGAIFPLLSHHSWFSPLGTTSPSVPSTSLLHLPPCHHAAIYSFLDRHPQPRSDPHTSALISLFLPFRRPSLLINFPLSFPSPPLALLYLPIFPFLLVCPSPCHVLTFFSPVLIS